jgi:hypothetical protein
MVTNKKWSTKVVNKRGVSEGQLSHVLSHDLTAVREVCMKLEDDYRSGITFIVIQKIIILAFSAHTGKNK